MHIQSQVVSGMIGFVILLAAASCGQAPEPVEKAGPSIIGPLASRDSLTPCWGRF